MKTLLYLLLLTALLAVTGFSQNTPPVLSPAPSPTPEIVDDGDVVKITTNLIQVDVTVTDSKGRIVTDLKPEEIQIFENDKKQTITNFSFINTETRTVEKQASGKTSDKTLVPAPSRTLKAEEVRRTIALVVDDLSLSFDSAYYVRRSLKKFVDEQMQPDDLVAIIRTGSGVGALQQFTSDKRQLYAAIERVKWNPLGGNISPFAPMEAAPAGGRNPIMDSDDLDAEADLKQFREDVFSVGTLGAVNYVVRGMRTLPGRKSIILFSDGFSLWSSDGQNYRVVNALRLLADLANRAAVVIYTLDARGLQYLGLSAVDNTAGMTATQIESNLSNRRNSFYNTQAGLGYLAQVTGGMAIKNNNDLSSGVQKILEDQKGFYLVGYEPDEKTFDPVRARFNTLTVKVTRPGLKVRYRSGFFGITDEDVKPAPKTPREQIINALVSPFATGDITVKLTPLFTADATRGSFISSLVYVRASDLKFTDEADGWKKAVFDIVVIALGDNGAMADQLARTETIRVRGEVYEKIMKEGFVYTVPFPIKKPGAYQMRVAVRDAETARIGSANQFIEAPDLKKNRLFLSGIIFQNAKNDNKKTGPENPDYAHDTGLRQFRTGTVLYYNSLIFNPKIDKATGQPKLRSQVKIFQNGKEIFTGTERDFVPEGQTDVKRLLLSGAVQLGTSMEPGEYVLQVIVTDTAAKGKGRIKTEWLDFEIVK